MWLTKVKAKTELSPVVQEARRIGQTLGQAWGAKITENVASLMANVGDEYGSLSMQQAGEIEAALRAAIKTAMGF